MGQDMVKPLPTGKVYVGYKETEHDLRWLNVTGNLAGTFVDEFSVCCLADERWGLFYLKSMRDTAYPSLKIVEYTVSPSNTEEKSNG